jgi:di/tricarboxylate transporter
MEQSGTARYLAEQMMNILGDDPRLILVGIYLFSALITQPMNNAAAVVLVVPIAIDMAATLGVNHMPLVLATVIGASTSFITPVGHQANVLVFGPGGYRFFDYTRVGVGLTFAILVATMISLPYFWPLN